MPKVRAKITIASKDQNNAYETIALLGKEKIIYQEPDTKTKVTFDYANNKLIRNNEELNMEYEFNLLEKTIVIIEVKSLKNYLNLNIITKEYIKERRNVTLTFLVENEEINYKIEVEEWV